MFFQKIGVVKVSDCFRKVDEREIENVIVIDGEDPEVRDLTKG